MNRLSRAITAARFLTSPSGSCAYIGWLGYDNLGDEVLYEVARECIAPLDLCWIPAPGENFLRTLVDHKFHACAILGGGTQIGDPSPIDWFTNRLKHAQTGVVFGAGVQPHLEGPLPLWLQRWGELLRPLPYVGVRGESSAATLARVGVNAEVLGDPVCWFSRPADHWKPEERTMGLNAGHSHGHMYGSEATIQETQAKFARIMIERGWRIEFFCVWPEDLDVTKRVACSAGIANPVIHAIYRDAQAYLRHAARMRLFVGIKLHAVAMAMCANVPSLMISYRDKCREFMASVGMEHFSVRSDEVDLDRMVDLADQLVADGPKVSESIREGMSPIQQRLGEVGREIRNVVTQSRVRRVQP